MNVEGRQDQERPYPDQLAERPTKRLRHIICRLLFGSADNPPQWACSLSDISPLRLTDFAIALEGPVFIFEAEQGLECVPAKRVR
jgi:hypothetical protein